MTSGDGSAEDNPSVAILLTYPAPHAHIMARQRLFEPTTL
jgi:hypothetical protein